MTINILAQGKRNARFAVKPFFGFEQVAHDDFRLDQVWHLDADRTFSRDRHENVGAGTIGVDGFAALLQHPTAAGLPVVVETPGHKAHEGHAKDIATLRSLVPTP